MTDQELSTLLREHVTSTETPFMLRPEESIRRGRGTRRRRKRAVVVAGLASVAVVIALGVGLPNNDGRDEGVDRIDPATRQAIAEYDAQVMPELVDEHVRAAVIPHLPLGELKFLALNDQMESLPQPRWEEAHAMEAIYGPAADHRFRIWLGHSRGEAEGDKARLCAEQTAGPDAFLLHCEATTLPDGNVAVTQVSAALEDPTDRGRSWFGLTVRNLRTGTVPRWAIDLAGIDRKLDPDDVYFLRTVEVVHSETFLTTAQEIVRAPSYEAALDQYAVPEDVLIELATDPQLVIPPPNA